MYVDKIDGRGGCAFFDQKAAEWRSEQRSLLRAIEGQTTRAPTRPTWKT